MLDVGTAAGAFLKAAKDDGWEVTGVEPNAWLADWGRRQYGVTIHVGSINKVAPPPSVSTSSPSGTSSNTRRTHCTCCGAHMRC